MRPDKSQEQGSRGRSPRLAVVAEKLAAVGDERAAVRRASRLGVARSELGAREPLTGSGWLEPVDLELPGGPSAAARARTEIRQAIKAVLPEDDSATVTLLTSELVTNAVVHAHQPDDASIGLRIIRSQERLRVEVTDSGRGFDPGARRRPEPGCGGLGLLLVARLSDRWGTARRMSNQRQRFCVWFEFRKSPG